MSEIDLHGRRDCIIYFTLLHCVCQSPCVCRPASTKYNTPAVPPTHHTATASTGVQCFCGFSPRPNQGHSTHTHTATAVGLSPAIGATQNSVRQLPTHQLPTCITAHHSLFAASLLLLSSLL